ncbi:MAG: hypothetical protein R3E50_06655 [Halioglobus sp.]
MSQYQPGTRLRSAVCTTEVVVIAAPAAEIALTCGGAPLLAEGETAAAGAEPDAAAAGGTLLGKRYTNEAGTLELLCVKPGKAGRSQGGRSAGNHAPAPAVRLSARLRLQP